MQEANKKGAFLHLKLTLSRFKRGWPARGPRTRAGGFIGGSKVLCARAPAHPAGPRAGPRGRFSEGLISRAPARPYFQNAKKRGRPREFFDKIYTFSTNSRF